MVFLVFSLGLGAGAAVFYLWSKLRKKATPLHYLDIFSPSQFKCRECLKRGERYCNTQRCAFVRLRNILAVMDSSKRSIDVCTPLLSCPVIIDSLEKSLAKGVKIRIIVDDDLTLDSKNLSKPCRNSPKTLPMKFAFQDGLMHHKFIVIDQEIVIIASTNLTTMAFFGNFENVEVTNLRFLVDKFASEFNYLWENVRQGKK